VHFSPISLATGSPGKGKTMKMLVNILAVILTLTLCFAPTVAVAATAQTIQVSGSIQEQFIQFAVTPHGVTVDAKDTWTGTLMGDGTLHIFSSDIIDLTNGIEANVVSARMLFTSDGNLFFSELGARNGDSVSVVSTIVRGTGKFKGATGQLVLQGLHTDTGVNFSYSGSITLAK
jgi:hypothetical protein